MKIDTVTTKVHTAVFSADDLKSVALKSIKAQVEVADTAIASAESEVGADGSIKVTIVETVPAEAEAPALSPALEVVAEPVPAPVGLVIPAAAGA